MRRIITAIRTIKRLCLNKRREPKHCNVDYKRRLVLIHNPKCAGTSLRMALGLDAKKWDHRHPSLYLSKKQWEDYFVIIVIREPLARIISAYRFHCRSDYDGVYRQRIPSLHGMQFQEYFNLVKSNTFEGIAHQYNFIHFPGSTKKPDCILYLERQEWSKIPGRFLTNEVKATNTFTERGIIREPIEMSEECFHELIQFLYLDYETFSDEYRSPKLSEHSSFGIKII